MSWEAVLIPAQPSTPTWPVVLLDQKTPQPCQLTLTVFLSPVGPISC